MDSNIVKHAPEQARPKMSRALVFYDMPSYPNLLGWTALNKVFYNILDVTPENIYWHEKSRVKVRKRNNQVDFEKLQHLVQTHPMQDADYLSIVKRLGLTKTLLLDWGVYTVLSRDNKSRKSYFMTTDLWSFPDLEWYQDFACQHYDLYGPAYGMLFDIEWFNDTPGSYIYFGTDWKYRVKYRLKKQAGHWQQHTFHRDKFLHRRYFRTVAPLSFLTTHHMNAPIEGMKFSKWVDARGKGNLIELRPDYWAWHLAEKDMPEVCDIMTDHNLLLDNLPLNAPLDLVPLN